MTCPSGRCMRHFICRDCLPKLTGLDVVRIAFRTEFSGFKGRRRPDGLVEDPEPGDYWRYPNDPIVGGPCWYIRDPIGHAGALRNHLVMEHDDGTISVHEAIVDDRSRWRIQRGVWEPC